jgi:hypothetical protein
VADFVRAEFHIVPALSLSPQQLAVTIKPLTMSQYHAGTSSWITRPPQTTAASNTLHALHSLKYTRVKARSSCVFTLAYLAGYTCIDSKENSALY